MTISPSVSFIAGDRGSWEVLSMAAVVGQPLEPAPFFDVRNEYLMRAPVDFRWLLRGVTSRKSVGSRCDDVFEMLPQPQLGRASATCAAFIPLKKKEAWWGLSEGEKREIQEGEVLKAGSSLKRLHGIAKQLHHCRDLGEPFDFLAWFEYSLEESGAFEEMLAALRASHEWGYVEREVDVRLVRRVA